MRSIDISMPFVASQPCLPATPSRSCLVSRTSEPGGDNGRLRGDAKIAIVVEQRNETILATSCSLYVQRLRSY